MMLHDAIRNATTERAVYFLLTAYLDTLQFSRKLPEHLTVAPIADVRDLELRFEELVAEFEAVLRLPDSYTFSVLREAVGIFNVAVVRVCEIQHEPADQGKTRIKSSDHHRAHHASAA